ncbi:hypothetical protein DID96_25525 [Burkholderia sp. Bp8963]|uniref:hypothetical protein n=1 Tax=Burkholderia sp. Bp8963 TaxID=2184547 RepID=UPI000F598278|nr:hypothetical protein [Burkholderia sp. Bp8963]RQS65787.1 hypothetical protein DID96_25525 [Burkholderia sp. Bp8963]
METVNELIMLIPGMTRSVREHYAARLSDGIEGYLETHGESVESFHRVGGDDNDRTRFDIRLRNGQRKIIDIVEIFWNDLRPPLAPSSAPLLGGLLVRYWLRLRHWNAIPRTSRSLHWAFCSGALFLLVWYLLTLLVFFQFAQLLFSLFLPSHVGTVAGWLWVGVTGLLASGFVTSNIDSSYAAYCYLNNRGGFCDRVRRRIVNAFWEISPQLASYQRITLLAHSFGSAVAVDAIARIVADADAAPPLQPFDLVTAGSPLEFLISRDRTYEQRIQRCKASALVCRWLDFYALTDSLCSKVPLGNESKCSNEGVALGYSEFEAFLGLAHDAYFEHPRVLQAVLAL